MAGAVAALAFPGVAAAEPFISSPPMAPLPMPAAVLVAAAGGGIGARSRAPSGAFVGADTGLAIMVGSGDYPAHDAWSFGGRVGYQWRSGLAIEARFDDLGVEPPTGGGALLVTSAGVRYSMPLVVMPFVEALLGPTFDDSHVAPAAGLGFGLSLPVLRHLALDLSFRDWIADLDGGVRNVSTVQLGVTVGFPGR